MKRRIFVSLPLCSLAMLVATTHADEAEPGKHLFILTGQSNMAHFNSDMYFTPIVEQQFGKDNVVVVRDAKGGQPISRWYRKWKRGESGKPVELDEKGLPKRANGELYVRLFEKVIPAIEGKRIQTVTFLWMQGEKDATMGWADVYRDSLKGLIEQVARDFGVKTGDINIVIGRLSDSGFKLPGNKPEWWNTVRDAQVEVAKAHPRGALVNTDDLNDGIDSRGRDLEDGLHYTVDGYKVFGERLATEAIALINAQPTVSVTFVLDQDLVQKIEAKAEQEKNAKAERKAKLKSGEIKRKNG